MPWTFFRPDRRKAGSSLAKGLRWFAGLLAAFVLLLAACATALTLYLKDQVVRLTAVDALDAARQEFVPEFIDTGFLLSASTTQALLARLVPLQQHLAHYENLTKVDETEPSKAQSRLSDVQRLIALTRNLSADANRSLTAVKTHMQFFRENADLRGDRQVNERRAFTRVAEAAEDEQRLQNAELLSLSTSVFGAMRILNEIGALTRYANDPSADRAPLSRIELSIKSLPSACIKAPEGHPPRQCNLSSNRLNAALAQLHASEPENFKRHIDEVRRAAAAFVRAGERNFQLLAYNIGTTLDVGTATRQQLSASTDTLELLKELSDNLAETENLLRQAETGQASDWTALDARLQAQFTQIFTRSLNTADAGITGRVAENKFQLAYTGSQTAWSDALEDLRAISGLRSELVTSVGQMNAALQKLAIDQRNAAQHTVGLISTVALAAMLLLGLMGVAFAWVGQTFVVRPIEKTTRTILALSDGHEIGPVTFGRGSFGFGDLGAALERLRLANIEREALTRQTLDQRAEIQQAHERLTTIANVAPVGLYEMTRVSDGTSRFQYFSDRFLDISGLSRDRMADDGADLFEHILEDDRPMAAKALEKSASTLAPFSGRFRIHDPAGELRWISIMSEARRGGEDAVTWTGAVIDVTADVARETDLRSARLQAEQSQALNEIQALHDGLTGLPNRRYFDQMLAERLSDARNGGPNDALLVRIDLDYFKHVNDTLGHEAGDLVLIRVADVLRRVTRAEDFAARVGGDEFSMLMAPGTTYEDAEAVTLELRDMLSEPFSYNGNSCRFGLSLGVARTDDFDDTGEDLNLFADAALYRAKELGRERTEIFTPELHQEILRNRSLAKEIHEALERREFEPFFQPQFYAKTGELAGAEVLLRWNHPREGILAPNMFMPVAEQLRIVSDIDKQVMEATRDAIARLRDHGIILPKVSLNISSDRMHDPNVIELGKTILTEETRVVFELLESILIEDESDLFRFHLDQLREAGIDIEIDDFGSGHASILGLMESGATALKIDQRLIQPLATDARTRNLVKAIIEIANTLDIATVAEGVETPIQKQYLTSLGCDILQGYLLSKPINEAALLKLLQSNARGA
jgi:diguanylate cyclase (GGDEF)-like protein/PAS domain S-box-containing protein